MTTYTVISDAQIDQDSPITQPLMTALRDNPIAIAEGADGAPTVALRNVRQSGSATWDPKTGPHQLNSGTLSLQEGKYIVSITAVFELDSFEDSHTTDVRLYHFQDGVSVLLDSATPVVPTSGATVTFTVSNDVLEIYSGDYFYMLQPDETSTRALDTTATLTLGITGPYKTDGYITAMSNS